MRQYRDIGEDGKVQPGRTVLIDIARTYDVLHVMSGKMTGPDWPERIGPSSIGTCAIYGGLSRWKAD